MSKFAWEDDDEVFDTSTNEGRVAFEQAKRDQASRLAAMRQQVEQEKQATTVPEDAE